VLVFSSIRALRVYLPQRREQQNFERLKQEIPSDPGPAEAKPADPTYRDTVAQVRSMSMIDLADAPQYPAQLLFLSTCSYHTKNGRFVVAAYRTYADETA
jgi:hypothetical protein